MGKTRTVHALPRLIRARRTRSQKDFGKDTCPAHDFQDVKVLCLQSQAETTCSTEAASASLRTSKDSLITSMLYPPVPDRTSPLTLSPGRNRTRHPHSLPPTTSTPNVLLPGPRRERIQNNQENSPPAAMPPSTHKEDSTSWPQSSNLFPETTGSQFRLVFKNTKENSIISSITLTTAPVVHRYPAKTFAKPENSTAAPASFPDPSLFVCPRTGFGHLGTSGGRRNPQLGRSRRRLGDSPHRNDSYWS